MRLSIISLIFPLLLTLQVLLEGASSAKILSISFFSSKSHKITYEPLLRALARRGHDVTVFTPVDSKNETNFRNIKLIDSEKFFNDLNKDRNFFDLVLSMPAFVQSIFNPLLIMRPLMGNLCRENYEREEVKALLNEKYDLVFFTPLGNECLYGLLYKLNTTVVLYQQMAIFPWLAGTLGTPSPTSFVSGPLIGYGDSMGFLERLGNFLKTAYDYILMDYYYLPGMEAIYREVFNDPNIPSVAELTKNVSLVLSNSHISFNKPRPLMQDLVEVGGLHLTPASPVPKELDEFLSGAKEGFIYFSMGTALKASTMPERYRKLFLSVFTKLKQRIIWKWEEEMRDLPPNVMVSKWFPQQDVLGHKNIRLFLTHGGMGSTAEAIYHGVPLVGIPMVGDQPSNMAKAAELGFALPPLDFKTLTEESLLAAINSALTESRYRDKAKQLSKIFLDQETKPLDRAVYWMEYVLRHNGALHLRSAARDLNFLQYFSIDVLLVLLILGGISLKINLMLLKFVWGKCFGKQKIADPKKKRN